MVTENRLKEIEERYAPHTVHQVSVESLAQNVKDASELVAEIRRLREGIDNAMNMAKLAAYTSAGDPKLHKEMVALSLVAGTLDQLLSSQRARDAIGGYDGR